MNAPRQGSDPAPDSPLAYRSVALSRWQARRRVWCRFESAFFALLLLALLGATAYIAVSQDGLGRWADSRDSLSSVRLELDAPVQDMDLQLG